MAKLETKIMLYDPHPGFGGALTPLPKPMKDLADRLDLHTMTLAEAIWKIKPVASELGGTISVEFLEKDGWGFIAFELPEGNGTNYWRLIRYTQNPDIIDKYTGANFPIKLKLKKYSNCCI